MSDSEAQLDALFFALSDPTRRAIVRQLLKHGPRQVSELDLPRKIGAPTLSKHLRCLIDCGLLTQKRAARRRLCQVNPDALRPAAEWCGYTASPRPVGSQRALLERYFNSAAGG